MGAEGSTGGPICSANELGDDTIDVVGAMKALIPPVEEAMTAKLKMAIDALQIIIMIKIS
jgi:hypothetical protein